MTSVLRFSDSFWDEQDRGVDILTEKLASSEQTCRDLKTIYEARAQIEKEYGQKLLELSQYTIGKVELGTLAESIQRIPKAFESTGKAHIDMAEQLEYSLEAPLESFLKEQSEIIDARTHQIENSKKLKDIHLAHVEKAKQAYDEANQVLKQKEQNGEDIESSKYSLAMADRQWKSAVENLQEVSDKFTLDWRITCDLYQDLEERRINFIRSNLWAFANMMSSVFIVDDRGCEGIRTGLEMTDVRKDINDFILKYGTSVKVTNGSPQSVHNDIIKSNDNGMTDTISSAFQDVENLLSDTASNERHSIISTTSSMDQYSVYSHSPKNNINRSSLASIHSPFDNENNNNNKIKENTIVMESPTYSPPNVNTDVLLNRSQPPSPPLPTSKKVPTPTKQSPLKGNGMNHNSNGDDDDDDDDDDDNDRNEMKLPLRTPKPKEEKWTISTRKNKTASMVISPPPKNNNNNNNNESTTSSKRNSFIPNTMSSSSSSSSLQIPPPKKSYLNPSVHPPPLKQSTSQPNIGVVSSASQSTILYPPENSHLGTNPASISNNVSPVYIIAPSSASTTSLVLNHNSHSNNNHSNNNNSNNNNNNNNNSNNSNQYSSQVYPPYNQPVNNYSPASHPPSTGNQNVNTTTTTTTSTTTYPPPSTTYQPVMTNQPATITSSYRPIVRPTSPNHYHPSEENSSAIHPTSTNNYYPATSNQNNINQHQQQQQIQPSIGHPQIIKSSSNDQEHTKNNYFTTNQPTTTTNYSQSNPVINNNNNHSTTIPTYQSQINHPPPPKNEQQQQPNIGIRPPKWEEKPTEEMKNIVASEYKQDEKDIEDSSAKSGGGLQRYNSVSGPREPPSKGNFIHSSELKNTHGVGEETVAILNNEQEATTTTTTTIIDTNLNKDHSDNSKPTSSSLSTQDSSSSTQPSSSKSGFSFNNIFFKKDKPAAVTEDEKRILSDGTPYKHKARAIWGYEAKIPSELSFKANDMLAVIRKQPDGWWEAEILDEQRKQRGLVPGNYLALN